MKKITLVAALIAVVSLFTLIQLACQPAADTNRSDVSAPNSNSRAEVVDTAAIEAELRRIENDWPRIIKERDVAAVGRVEADDVILVYPDGSVGNKQQELTDVAAGNLTADSLEIKDLQVKVLDADAAIVLGHNALKNGKLKLPDGKTMDITGEYRFIDTFARRNGEWKLVAGISTRIMAPAASASPAASPGAKTSPSAAAASPAAARPSPSSSATP